VARSDAIAPGSCLLAFMIRVTHLIDYTQEDQEECQDNQRPDTAKIGYYQYNLSCTAYRAVVPDPYSLVSVSYTPKTGVELALSL
jgi:hypothetical protein